MPGSWYVEPVDPGWGAIGRAIGGGLNAGVEGFMQARQRQAAFAQQQIENERAERTFRLQEQQARAAQAERDRQFGLDALKLQSQGYALPSQSFQGPPLTNRFDITSALEPRDLPPETLPQLQPQAGPLPDIGAGYAPGATGMPGIPQAMLGTSAPAEVYQPPTPWTSFSSIPLGQTVTSQYGTYNPAYDKEHVERVYQSARKTVEQKTAENHEKRVSEAARRAIQLASGPRMSLSSRQDPQGLLNNAVAVVRKDGRYSDLTDTEILKAASVFQGSPTPSIHVSTGDSGPKGWQTTQQTDQAGKDLAEFKRRSPPPTEREIQAEVGRLQRRYPAALSGSAIITAATAYAPLSGTSAEKQTKTREAVNKEVAAALKAESGGLDVVGDKTLWALSVGKFLYGWAGKFDANTGRAKPGTPMRPTIRAYLQSRADEANTTVEALVEDLYKGTDLK